MEAKKLSVEDLDAYKIMMDKLRKDYDVDGQDLALLASAAGAELQALAGSFGQIL